MQSRDARHLLDMLEAAGAIQLFLARLVRPTREEFAGDRFVRNAVAQKLGILGDAAARVSNETRVAWPGVPWQEARDIRKLVAQAQFSADWREPWTAAAELVPKLRAQLERVLDSMGIEHGG